MFTTSRYASKKTKDLALKMAKENKERFISRGKHTIAQLVELARRNGEEKIFVIEERKKQPAVIVTIEVSELGEWRWVEEKPIKS